MIQDRQERIGQFKQLWATQSRIHSESCKAEIAGFQGIAHLPLASQGGHCINTDIQVGVKESWSLRLRLSMVFSQVAHQHTSSVCRANATFCTANQAPSSQIPACKKKVPGIQFIRNWLGPLVVYIYFKVHSIIIVQHIHIFYIFLQNQSTATSYSTTDTPACDCHPWRLLESLMQSLLGPPIVAMHRGSGLLRVAPLPHRGHRQHADQRQLEHEEAACADQDLLDLQQMQRQQNQSSMALFKVEMIIHGKHYETL